MAAKHVVIPIKQVGAAAPVEDDEMRLLREGWQRKTTIGEPRLSELVENYKNMGFEVHVIEFRSQSEGCNTCFDAGQEMGQVYGEVYVRKGSGGRTVDDELF